MKPLTFVACGLMVVGAAASGTVPIRFGGRYLIRGDRVVQTGGLPEPGSVA